MPTLSHHKSPQPLSDEELDALYAMLTSYAMRHTSDFDEALDAVQEALTTTLERACHRGEVENFKAYCFQVLRSKLALRGAHPTVPLEAAETGMEKPEGGFDFQMEQALSLLPAQEREVVKAHDIEAEGIDRIAFRLGLSTSYATKLLSQGHTRLKRLLKNE